MLSSLPVGFSFDLPPDFEEVHELFAFAVKELSIFAGTVDQLENQRSSGHDAVATGKEIPAKKRRKTFV